jgi:hypothetical protein
MGIPKGTHRIFFSKNLHVFGLIASDGYINQFRFISNFKIMSTIKLNPELAKTYGVETIEEYRDLLISYCESDNQAKIQEMAEALSDEEAKAVGDELTTTWHYDILDTGGTEEQFLKSLYLYRSPQ